MALPTTTSEGKCWREVTRLMLIAVATPYTNDCDHRLGYSCAMAEAEVQLRVAWREGNDDVLPITWKNLPCPSVTVGRSRPNTSLVTSFTARLSIMASP